MREPMAHPIAVPANVIWRARAGEMAHAFGVGPGEWQHSVCGGLRWSVLVKPPTELARCTACLRVLGLIS